MDSSSQMKIKLQPASGSRANIMPMTYDPVFILAHVYNEPDIEYLQNINIKMKNEILKDIMQYMHGILKPEEIKELSPLFSKLFSELALDLEMDFNFMNKNLLKVEDKVLEEGKKNAKVNRNVVKKKISSPKPVNVPKPGMTSKKKQKHAYDLIEQSLRLMRRPLTPH